MKRIILIAVVFMLFVAGINAASFDGVTGIGVNYEWRDGLNLGGLSIQNFGYVDDYPLGYFVGINSDFNPSNGNNMTIGLVAGPSYRYMISDVPMSIEVALGVSVSGEWFGEDDIFGLGIGGYIGATYYMTDDLSLMLGCTLGYDMLAVDLQTGEASFYGNFYVIPSIALGFRY